MNHLTAALYLMLISTVSFAQENRVAKRIALKVAVKDSIQRVDYGYLAGLADSGIVMVKYPAMFDHSLVGTTANSLAYQNLSEVAVHSSLITNHSSL